MGVPGFGLLPADKEPPDMWVPGGVGVPERDPAWPPRTPEWWWPSRPEEFEEEEVLRWL